MIVASTAGSNPDTIARIAASGLSAVLGQHWKRRFRPYRKPSPATKCCRGRV